MSPMIELGLFIIELDFKSGLPGSSKARIAPQNGAREEVGPAVGGGPLMARSWGPVVTTGMLVVATSRLVFVVLSSDDGGMDSIQGRQAHL